MILMMFPKENAWRCKRYTDWVKTRPSIVSQRPAHDPHHIKGYGFGGSVKAPDWAVIPLTRDEHDALHEDIEAVEETFGTQLELLMRFWRQNFDEIKRFFK